MMTPASGPESLHHQPSSPARRVGVRASRRDILHEAGSPSPGGERPRASPAHSRSLPDSQKGWRDSRSRFLPRSRVNGSTSPRAVTYVRRGERRHAHGTAPRHGGRGARDHLRAGAAEGGGGVVGARAAEEARRREDRAPAPALHAAVVRRRHGRGDAEDPGRGGGRDRGRGGLGRRCCLPVLRVAGRLHREHPQEPGLRDHLRPPRHGGVRGGRGGGADDGELAVQEAGHDGDRGGGGAVRGRGGLRRGVRVGIQRAQQDRPDVHAGLQRLRRLPHRQHRRGPLLRGRAPGLVRRHVT